ncbi:MAG: hypothetical protein J4G14_02495 [Dehalococcoidia bacterium]|nr:hypothetical protein [Dehalococcoidia bacterium]
MKYTNLNRRIPWKVFANINIQYADEWAEDMYERIQDDKTGWYQNATVVIDELPEIMNSKRSVSGAVVAVEAQLRQLRKDMMDLLGTAQWPHELTSSILRQTDLLIQPRLFKKKVRGLDGQWREIAMVKSAIWNWNGSLTGRPLFGMKWPAPYETADQFRTDFGIENTWNYYSTDSKVQNIHTDAGKQAAVDRKRDREFQELAMSLMNGRNKVPYEEFQIFAGTYLDCDNPTMFAEAARVMRLVVTESDGQQFVELPSAVMEHLDTPAAKQARFEVEMENLRLYG